MNGAESGDRKNSKKGESYSRNNNKRVHSDFGRNKSVNDLWCKEKYFDDLFAHNLNVKSEREELS